MALMPINGYGITLGDTKSQMARLTPTQSKATTLNSVIIWLGSLVDRVVFLVAHMRWNVRCVCLSIVSMADNFINNVSRTILLT